MTTDKKAHIRSDNYLRQAEYSRRLMESLGNSLRGTDIRFDVLHGDVIFELGAKSLDDEHNAMIGTLMDMLPVSGKMTIFVPIGRGVVQFAAKLAKYAHEKYGMVVLWQTPSLVYKFQARDAIADICPRARVMVLMSDLPNPAVCADLTILEGYQNGPQGTSLEIVLNNASKMT
jgi:hypothetical protein